MRHDDDPFDDALRDAMEDYHRPDTTPRREMWLRVQAARATAHQARRKKRQLAWPLLWSGGIAAGLLMGVGVGRFILSDRTAVTIPAAPDAISVADTIVVDGGTSVVDSVVAAPPQDMAMAKAVIPRKRARGGARASLPSVEPVLPAGLPSAYRVTMAEHLGNAEVFLTLFRFSVERGAQMAQSTATARQLLSTNRLLLDSPVGKDRESRALLEDLEFVLVRIVQVSSRSQSSELKVIATGLEQSKMMARLRSEVPAGPWFAVGQGGL